MSDLPWELYLALLNTLTVATTLVIFISTADDFFLDAFYWVRELWLWPQRGRTPVTISAQSLREREEQWLAIMVPAWKEYDVIAKMVENTLATMEYTRFIIFAGAYRNDAETTTEVERMVRRYPGRVVRAAVTHDGPTCKADCLNTIIQTIIRHEAGHGIRFAGVIMHDCEDVIHPLELKYFNYFILDQDLVQLPVLSLERKWYEWVAGTYMDDFSETHQKDLVARQALTGTVPGAGVALCYSRRAIEAVMKVRGDSPFNTSTLTEDYDFSFRLRELGMREAFVHFPICENAEPTEDAEGKTRTRWRFGRRKGTRPQLLATREYFPSTFRTAYRQRALGARYRVPGLVADGVEWQPRYPLHVLPGSKRRAYGAVLHPGLCAVAELSGAGRADVQRRDHDPRWHVRGRQHLDAGPAGHQRGAAL